LKRTQRRKSIHRPRRPSKRSTTKGIPWIRWGLFFALFFWGGRFLMDYKGKNQPSERLRNSVELQTSEVKNVVPEDPYNKDVWQGTLHQLMRQRNLTLKDAWNVLKPLSGAFRWDDTLTVVLVSRKVDRRELMLKIEHDSIQHRFYKLDIAEGAWVNEDGCMWYSPCWRIPVEGWVSTHRDSLNNTHTRVAPESVVHTIAAGSVRSVEVMGQQSKVCIAHSMNIKACYRGIERTNSSIKPGSFVQKGDLIGWLGVRSPRFELELFHLNSKLDASQTIFSRRLEDLQRLRSFLLSNPELLKI
jgi:hypothetical protein